MCQTPPEIDLKLIVDTIQEYSRRKGVYVKKKEAKQIATNFEKRYGRYPTFKEIWDIAEKVIAQKATGKKLTIKPDKMDEAISKKMAEMKEADTAKAARKKELKKERKEGKGLKCSKCGYSNPKDSKFCLECGNKLG